MVLVCTGGPQKSYMYHPYEPGGFDAPFFGIGHFWRKKEDVQKTNYGTRMHLASLEEITAYKVRYILNYHVERQ
jgi:hypothetical protein